MAKTDNLDNDEVYDAIKNPLERPLEVANDYNKRSEIGTSKSIDKISKLEGDSSQGKIKSETDELVLSAIMVELSSNSATHFLLKDKVETPWLTLLHNTFQISNRVKKLRHITGFIQF